MGSYGPFGAPVVFFLEEVLLEEFLGVGNPLVAYYPLSLPIVVIIISAFYSFVFSFVLWGVKYKKLPKVLFIFFIIFFFVTVLCIQVLEIAFSDSQCPLLPSEGSSGIFSLQRDCAVEHSPQFSIPENFFQDPLLDDVLVSQSELDKMREHSRNMRYFCHMGCERHNFQCRHTRDSDCLSCTDTCRREYRDEMNHIVDYLKSPSFQKCMNTCRP